MKSNAQARTSRYTIIDLLCEYANVILLCDMLLASFNCTLLLKNSFLLLNKHADKMKH